MAQRTASTPLRRRVEERDWAGGRMQLCIGVPWPPTEQSRSTSSDEAAATNTLPDHVGSSPFNHYCVGRSEYMASMERLNGGADTGARVVELPRCDGLEVRFTLPCS